MRSRFFILAVLVLALIVAMAVPGGTAAKLRFAMVTDIGGLGDKGFNDSAYNGLKMLAKEYGADIQVLESKKAEDYIPNLKNLAEQGYDMIWAVGFLMTDSLTQVAKQYPKIKFGQIDDVIDLPNVTSVTFKEEEGSYLMGVIAGKTTKTGLVGFVGGMEVPLIAKFEAGFRAGVAAVNPKAKVLVNYTGSFNDPAKGKETAIAQYTLGADVVYHASGACGIGVIAAAKDKNLWAMGVDMDQHSLAPNNVLACMVKRVDMGVLKATKSVMAGKGGGHVIYGLADEGVGICDSAAKTAAADVLKLAEKYRTDIISGKIKVPDDPKSLK